jgi:hypothetical protein
MTYKHFIDQITTKLFSCKFALQTLLYCVVWRDCADRWSWRKVVSFDWSLLKGEVLRFSANIYHPLACEEPFKCWCHLVQDLRCYKVIPFTVHIFGSGLSLTLFWYSNSANTSFEEQSQLRYEFLKICMFVVFIKRLCKYITPSGTKQWYVIVHPYGATHRDSCEVLNT